MSAEDLDDAPLLTFYGTTPPFTVVVAVDAKVYVDFLGGYEVWREHSPAVYVTGGTIAHRETRDGERIADILRRTLAPDDPRWSDTPRPCPAPEVDR